MSQPDSNQQLPGGGGGGGGFGQSKGPLFPPYMQQGAQVQAPHGPTFQYPMSAHGARFAGTMPDALLAGAAGGAQQPSYVPDAQGLPAGHSYLNYEDAPEPSVTMHLVQHQQRMNEMLAASRAQMQQEKQSQQQLEQQQQMQEQQQQQQQEQEAQPSSRPPEKKRPARKSVSPQEAWDAKFVELEAFYDEFGHSDVPQTFKANRALGKWVGKQREHYKNLMNGKASPLTEDRRARLETLDFKFQMGKGQHAKIHGIFITDDLIGTWEARYKDLVEFKEKYGHVDVPVKYPANRALGRWVALQRRKFRELESKKISSSSVLDTRMQRLRDIGFKFSIGRGDYVRASTLDGGLTNHEELWEERLRQLEAYKEEHGNCDVPQGYSDKKLASWVTKQREQYKLRLQGKHNSMTDERLAKLETLGFHFRAYAALWEERLEELRKFKEEHGTTNVKTTDNSALYIWVTRQRQTFRDFLEGRPGPMDHDRIRKLEELGFDWRYDGSRAKKSDKKSLSTTPSKRSSHTPSKRTPGAKKSDMPKPSSATTEKPEGEVGPQPQTEQKDQDGEPKLEDSVNEGVATNGPSEKTDDQPQGAVPSEDRQEVSALETDVRPHEAGESDLQAGDMVPTIERREEEGEPKIETVGGVLIEGDDEAGIEFIGTDVDNVPYVADNTGGDRQPPLLSDQIQQTAGPNEPNMDNLATAATQVMAEGTAAGQESPQEETKLPEITFDIDDIDLDGKPLKRGTKPEVWLRHYQELLAFKIENGHCRVPCKYKVNKRLGSWVKLQREDYKKMKEKKATPMCKYRIDLLEKIGFEWRIAPEQKTPWEDRLEALEEFKREHGHCDVPQAYPKDVALGKWVSKQRDFYRFMKEGKPTRMTEDRVQKLDAIGFRWVVGKGRALRTWEDYFKDLVRFKEKHGHTNIPVGYKESPALGTWASQQRKNFMKRNEKSHGSRKGLAERLRRLEEMGFQFHVKEPAGKKTPKKTKEGSDATASEKEQGRSKNEETEKEGGKESVTEAPQKRDRPKKTSDGETEKKQPEGETPKKSGRPKKAKDDEKAEDHTDGELPKISGRPKKASDGEKKDDSVAQKQQPKKGGRPKKASDGKVDESTKEGDETKKAGSPKTAPDSEKVDEKMSGGEQPKQVATVAMPKKRGRPKKALDSEKADATVAEGDQPKKRGRPPKVEEDEKSNEDQAEREQPKKGGTPKKVKDEEKANEGQDEGEQPKKRGRSKKVPDSKQPDSNSRTEDDKPKRRGRPKKANDKKAEEKDAETGEAGSTTVASEKEWGKDKKAEEVDKVKKRGRPRKAKEGENVDARQGKEDTPKKRGRPRKRPADGEASPDDKGEEVSPAKKKRGRPKKSDGGKSQTDGSISICSWPKKRGRPAGKADGKPVQSEEDGKKGKVEVEKDGAEEDDADGPQLV